MPPRPTDAKAAAYRPRRATSRRSSTATSGRYSNQIERFYEALGRDQVKVVIFEEFRKDPAAAYRGVLEFLGVDPDFKPNFDVVNAGIARRS